MYVNVLLSGSVKALLKVIVTFESPVYFVIFEIVVLTAGGWFTLTSKTRVVDAFLLYSLTAVAVILTTTAAEGVIVKVSVVCTIHAGIGVPKEKLYHLVKHNLNLCYQFFKPKV